MSSSINSLDTKLVTERSNLDVNCLNGIDEQFVWQKELRKKTFERRMKSRIKEEKKNRKRAKTLMIIEDENENGGSWKKDNTKKQWMVYLDDDDIFNESIEGESTYLDDDGDYIWGQSVEGESACLEEDDYILDKSIEVIPSADSNKLVDILIEIISEKDDPYIFLKGSWDDWNDIIQMKFSQFTNSFLAVLSLPLSKGEYEFLFFQPNPKQWFGDIKYSIRCPPKTLKNEKAILNFVKLNSTSQIDNQNSSWTENRDLLRKILITDNSMVELVNQMKKNRFPKSYVNIIKRKYLEIRNTLSIRINSQQMKALTDEADRAHTYLEIIIFVLNDWAILEERSTALMKCENAKEIRVEYVNMLKEFMMSKEEIIHQFKYNFCHPLLRECCRYGLKYKSSKEIQQLNAFLNADFSHNNLPT